MRGHPKVTDKQILQCVHKHGLTQAQIARKYGMSRASMSTRFRKLGLSVKPSTKVQRTVVLHPDTIKTIDYLSGITGDLKGEVIDTAVRLYDQSMKGQAND